MDVFASPEFWRVVKEIGGQGATDALPPFCAYAVTAGGAAVSETVDTVTTLQVPVWLNGVAQDAENRTWVVLPYGTTEPGAGELWLVLLPNFTGPGVLLLRLSQ